MEQQTKQLKTLPYAKRTREQRRMINGDTRVDELFLFLFSKIKPVAYHDIAGAIDASPEHVRAIIKKAKKRKDVVLLHTYISQAGVEKVHLGEFFKSTKGEFKDPRPSEKHGKKLTALSSFDLLKQTLGVKSAI